MEATREQLEQMDRMKAAQQNVLAADTIALDPDLSNPSERPRKSSAERQRVPMSVPVQKLEVPPIPGFHLYWFRGWEPGRIQRAKQAGYEFVSWSEVSLNNLDLGGESADSGNTDLGSGVSVVASEDVGEDGQPQRLVLMKIKEEWWEADQALLAERNEKIAEAIRGGKVGAGGSAGEGPGDQKARYTRGTENLFTPKRKR